VVTSPVRRFRVGLIGIAFVVAVALIALLAPTRTVLVCPGRCAAIPSAYRVVHVWEPAWWTGHA